MNKYEPKAHKTIDGILRRAKTDDHRIGRSNKKALSRKHATTIGVVHAQDTDHQVLKNS